MRILRATVLAYFGLFLVPEAAGWLADGLRAYAADLSATPVSQPASFDRSNRGATPVIQAATRSDKPVEPVSVGRCAVDVPTCGTPQ